MDEPLQEGGNPLDIIFRSNVTRWFVYIMAALNGLFAVGVYIFVVIVFIVEFDPAAFMYLVWWFPHIASAAFIINSAMSGGRGDAVYWAIVRDIIGVVLAVIALLSAGAFLGLSWQFNWDCTLNEVPINVLGEILCKHEWIIITIWWLNITIGFMLPIFTAAAHLFSFLGIQSPKRAGATLPFSSGGFFDRALFSFRSNRIRVD